jgi:DNA-binding transcriptional LysR family regulator
LLDWNDLRHFLAVAHAGTLAGAARELGVEHTTVGRRLAALETALAAKLFTRGPDGFALTAAGTEILALAEQMAKNADAIARRAAGDDGRIEGNVRLSTSEALSGYVVRQLGALRERHPALTVEILSGNRAFDVMRGEADMALRIREIEDSDLVVRKVAVAGWALYAAPTYLARKGTPATPEDLDGHDVIDFDATLGEVPGALWLKEHAKGATVVTRGNSIIAVLNAATFGMGLATLPCFLGDAETALTRVSDERVGTRNVFLVVHPDLARVARVRAVVDHIVEAFTRDRRVWSGERA